VSTSDSQRVRAVVLGRRKPAEGVATRDFRAPRRLGPARRAALELALKNALPALERKLFEAAGLATELKLVGLDEADADALFVGASEPLCVQRFRCPKALAWLVWEPSAAAAALEAVLGARAPAGSARRLSPTEVRIANQLLGEVVRAVCAALALAPSELTLVQARPELGSWREAGADAQSHRLEVRLELALAGQTSTLRLYLPGIQDEGAAAEPEVADLPAHLARVEVELSACLLGSALTLDQLLALEEGDVIPLEARLGDAAALRFEGLTLAEARLGSHRGRLAVRVERLSLHSEPA
jgi:flagellar motor switch protein FliM